MFISSLETIERFTLALEVQFHGNVYARACGHRLIFSIAHSIFKFPLIIVICRHQNVIGFEDAPHNYSINVQYSVNSIAIFVCFVCVCANSIRKYVCRACQSYKTKRRSNLVCLVTSSLVEDELMC